MHRSSRLFNALLMMLSIACRCAAAASQDSDESERMPIVEASRDVHVQAPPAKFIFDGSITEWRHQPATTTFDTTQGPLELWIAECEDGLVVAGRLAHQARGGSSAPLAESHVELEFASLASVRLPALFLYGEQRLLHRADDCVGDPRGVRAYDAGTCRSWVDRQLDYRKMLVSALFSRRIALDSESPPSVGPNLDDDAEQLGILRELTEREPVQIKRIDKARTRTFELLIPWNALPATDNLQLSAIYFGARVAGGARSVTAATFVRVVLPAPREYRLTRCSAPLVRATRIADFFLPAYGQTIEHVFSFRDGEQEQPVGRSPLLVVTHYLDEEIAPKGYLCAPYLAYSDGATFTVSTGELLIHPEDDWNNAVHPDWDHVLQMRPVDDGNLLIRYGPFKHASLTGRGQCGACPRTTLAIWYLDRGTPAFHEAFGEEGIADPAMDENIEMSVSDDWREIRVVDERPYDEALPLRRTAKRYCLAAGSRQYLPCEETTGEP